MKLRPCQVRLFVFISFRSTRYHINKLTWRFFCNLSEKLEQQSTVFEPPDIKQFWVEINFYFISQFNRAPLTSKCFSGYFCYWKLNNKTLSWVQISVVAPSSLFWRQNQSSRHKFFAKRDQNERVGKSQFQPQHKKEKCSHRAQLKSVNPTRPKCYVFVLPIMCAHHQRSSLSTLQQ